MKKSLKTLVAVVLSTMTLAACSSGTAASSTVKLGLNYELSGDVSTYGAGLVQGIEMAVAEINAAGGVLGKQIELVKADNKSQTDEAANVSARLATRDKVVAILGPATSGNVKAALPAAQENKVPLISASATAADVTLDSNGKVREYVFKTCFSDSFQGVTMANFAFNELKFTKAAILRDNTSDYSKGLTKSFTETFTKLGGSIVGEQAYQAKDSDFKTLLTSIKAANPEVLFVPGYYEEVGLIIKQARELGLNVPVLGADGFDSPKLLEIAGAQALENVYYSNHYTSSDTTPEVVKFKEAFNKKNGKDPDAFNALGYDMAYMVADAIKRAGAADPVKLKDALAATKDFKGITGNLTMDAFHNPIKAVTILKVENGVPTYFLKQQP
ncbi:ABC transporter substrate-binding protein [Proteiniclasticum sp. QWL-01]|uniref:ABC transporter substrate-binding protein n=1 Tax=Proteiniclasticum sp. QWL-01 TaxID=3036945 RepID=UPI002410B00E|nr:ABC transporter substrate-binding protein [Proteiniclasticum sp. QWL-01]WFF72556.1 ABC transporter substrate-binding protein [Proteiniclasticum sp. QWL-01]